MIKKSEITITGKRVFSFKIPNGCC